MKRLSCFIAIICFACMPAITIAQSANAENKKTGRAGTDTIFLTAGIILAVVVVVIQIKNRQEKIP